MIRALSQEEKENVRGGTTLTKEQAEMINNNIGKEDSMSEIKQNVSDKVAKELKKREMQYAQTVANPKSNEEDEKNLDEIVNEHELNVSEQYELSDDIEKYKNQLVTLDNHSIMEYGYEAQSNLTKLSRDVLDKTESSNVKPISKQLDSLVQIMNDSDPEQLIKEDDRSWISKMIRKPKHTWDEIFNKLTTDRAKIDKIDKTLKSNNEVIKKDIDNLEKLYAINKQYYEQVNALIEAGNVKIEELRNNNLVELQNKAQQSGEQIDKQAVSDMEDFINRLEKRVHTLETSREVTSQTAPQIRMIQNLNQTLAEKIQDTSSTSISLWMTQMSIAQTIAKQRRVTKSQEQIDKVTNDLIKNNANMLNQNAKAIATQNEKPTIEADVLQESREKILQTIDDVLKIQEEGKAKREQDRAKLQSTFNSHGDAFEEVEQIEHKQ